MALLVLSVVGSDRPGLTRALAAAVLSAGGNWLESHLSRLGGLYVGSVLVEIEPERDDALRRAVSAIDAEGLEVRVAPAHADAPAEAAAEGAALEVALVGQDRPGIVDQVTAALSGLRANIESFSTRVAGEAYSGAPLFHLQARVRLPHDLAATEVQTALEAISAEIMVDLSVTPAA